MKSVKIRVSFPGKASRFIEIVNRYPYDMELRSGRHVMDAKNALALALLGGSGPVTLVIQEDDCGPLLEELRPFIVTEEE